MNEEKKAFLKLQFIPLLKGLSAEEKGRWGLMNGQHMVEHFDGAVKIANGKLVLPMINKDLELEKARAFLLSEKPLKENTKTPLMGNEPPPLRKPDMGAAIAGLQKELDIFFEAFDKDPSLKTTNPLFGELDYAMNVQLLYKHAIHHLRQFGLIDQHP
jgi:hypothetical protein